MNLSEGYSSELAPNFSFSLPTSTVFSKNLPCPSINTSNTRDGPRYSFLEGETDAQTDRENRSDSPRTRRQSLPLLRRPQISARTLQEHATAIWRTLRPLFSVPASSRIRGGPHSNTLDVRNIPHRLNARG